MVSTFKTLCELADFNSGNTTSDIVSSDPASSSQEGHIMKHALGKANGMSINLNIQLVLPTTEDATIYDAIFKSMQKHLIESG